MAKIERKRISVTNAKFASQKIAWRPPVSKPVGRIKCQLMFHPRRRQIRLYNNSSRLHVLEALRLSSFPSTLLKLRCKPLNKVQVKPSYDNVPRRKNRLVTLILSPIPTSLTAGTSNYVITQLSYFGSAPVTPT